jgi:N-acetylglucosaminyl-diphospho-decaprenol L-rhamnosyltransferase
MTSKDITIIITTYKSEEKIENCLNSIDSEFKVIIVENSNNKKFKNDIEKKFQNVECILTGDNLGYGRANNIGLRKVSTKYSLILNPDTILEKKTISNFFIFLKRDINFAILGPSQSRDDSELEIHEYNYTNLLKVSSVKGFAMFLNMSKFLDINFFDENFFLYLEEIDLCKRLTKIKENIYVDKNIKIFHYGGKSVNKTYSHEIELTRNWHWMWSFFYFNKKHFNYFHALVIVIPKFFSALFKSIFYKFLLKNKKSEIYRKRLSGLFNSIIGKPSWYRPTLD